MMEMDSEYFDVSAQPQPQAQKLHNLPLRRRLLKRDKKKFMKYASSTTTHGVRHIFFGKSKIRRALWALLFLFVFVGCCYTTVDRILHYVSVPTATTVSTVHARSIQFPAITLCNTNSFRKSYLDKKNLTELVQSAFRLVITNSSNYLDEYQNQCRAHESATAGNATFREIAIEGGQKLEDFVLDCNFVGLPCNIKEEFIPTLTELGVCYTFNSGQNYPLRHVQGSGYRHDLEVVLNIEQHQYGAAVDNDAGVRVTIHNPEHPPQPLEHGISIPPGKGAFIGLGARTFDDKSETKMCKVPGSRTGFDFLKSYNYSFPSCLQDCLLRDIADTCQCIDNIIQPPTDGPYAHLPLCNISQLCCTIATLTVTEECYCVPECTYTSYDVSTSYSAYPAQIDIEKVAEQYNATPEIVQHSFIKVHIFFEQLTIVEEVTVRSYTIGSLLSDIGGELGLFLGASIISLTELLTWILDEIKDRCFGMNERRVMDRISSIMEDEEENDHKYELDQLKYRLDIHKRTDMIQFEESTRL